MKMPMSLQGTHLIGTLSIFALACGQIQKNGKSRLEPTLEKLAEIVRVADGRDAKTSLCIIDSQIVKNTDTAKEKGMMEGRKFLESRVM
jgi:hypothetical protein